MLGGHAMQAAAHYPAPAMSASPRLPSAALDNITHHHHHHHHHHNVHQPPPANLSIPALYPKTPLSDPQPSPASHASSAFAAPQFPSSSSNVSTSTGADTDLTSPASQPLPQTKPLGRMKPPSPAYAHVDHVRLPQPAPSSIDTANLPRTGDTAASPMSVTSPAAHGFKRTADGAVKTAMVSPDSAVGPRPAPAPAHKRTKSMETGAGSRIGEVRVLLWFPVGHVNKQLANAPASSPRS